MARVLPTNPNLTHLRNEAKALHRAHRSGSATACETLRSLPHLSRKNDRELLDTDVPLADIQCALARAYGFSSWARLKEHVAARNVDRPANGSGNVGLLGTSEAWDALGRAVEDIRRLPESVTSHILSMNVVGSLVRGDFVKGRSHVVLITICDDAVSMPAMKSPEYEQVHACVARYLDPYAPQIGAHPLAFEDLWLNRRSLPLAEESWMDQSAHPLTLFYFDTHRYHKTLLGEDLSNLMPPPRDPRPPIPEWVTHRLVRKSDVEYGLDSFGRMHVRAWIAIRAVQLYYSDDLSLDKQDVRRRYETLVPDFPLKAFGADHWQRYLNGSPANEKNDPRTIEDFFAFLVAVQQLLRDHPRVFA
jgi:hypothetical protein